MFDSVSRELTSLSLMAITLSLTAAPLNFNFFFIVLGSTVLGLLCFGVDVLPGVTAFVRSAFIAPDTIIVLVETEFKSIDSISSALSDKDSTIVMSAETSFNVLNLSLGFGLSEKDLK